MTWATPIHFTTNGNHAICGNPSARSLAFDHDDPAISCDKCRLWLAGYRAGREAR